MVAIENVGSINATFFQQRPLVAVLIGATSGIGEYAIRTLAATYSTQKSSLRLYFVGRNDAAAEKISSDCSRICPNAAFTFLKADDLASLKEVDRVSVEILKLEREQHKNDMPRIDLLVMTQGRVVFGQRQETREGLDRTMSLIYYSRIRFIIKLMPLLLAAPQSAHVVSVYAAGLEAKLFNDDLSLRNPKNYSQINARSHNAYMTTMAFEHLAKQYQKLSFVHAFPGIVVTPSYTDPGFQLWFKLLWRLFGPLVRKFQAISAEDSGSRIIFLGTSRFAPQKVSDSATKLAEVAKGTNGTLGSGAYAVGADSETVTSKADLSMLRKEGFERAIWEHTMKAFNDIEAGRVFVE